METQLNALKKELAIAIDQLEKLESIYFFEQLPTHYDRVRKLTDKGIELLAEIASKSETDLKTAIRLDNFAQKYRSEINEARLDLYFQK